MDWIEDLSSARFWTPQPERVLAWGANVSYLSMIQPQHSL